MADVIRRTPEDVKSCVEAGALLVCAYDNSEKFATYQLDGAIPLSELRAKEATLATDQELIFYCA